MRAPSHYHLLQSELAQRTPRYTQSDLEANECKDELERFLPEFSYIPGLDGVETWRRSSWKSTATAGIVGAALLFALLCFFSENLAERRSSFGDNTDPAVVIASYSEQDVSWITEIPDPWRIHRYCHDCGHNITSDEYGERLPAPSDAGREAAVYLTFIIDNYDNLPPYSVFLHGHDTAWHQPERAVHLIRALNFTALDQEGYIPFKCSFETCDPSTKHPLKGGPQSVPGNGFFDHLFKMVPPFWKWAIGDTLHQDDTDEYYRGVATAQFAVTAASIRRTPLEDWIALRAPLVEEANLEDFDSLMRNISIAQWGLAGDTTRYTVFGTGQDESNFVNKWSVGVLYELTWHRIFGKPAISCPAEETCRESFFSGAIHCPVYDEPAPSETGDDVDGTALQKRWGRELAPCSANETAMAQIYEENMGVLRRMRRPGRWDSESLFSSRRGVS